MSVRNRNKRVFKVEALEGRIALSNAGGVGKGGSSDFGHGVANQAQTDTYVNANGDTVHFQINGVDVTFGEWQSYNAQNGGLGQYNRNGGSSKTQYL